MAAAPEDDETQQARQRAAEAFPCSCFPGDPAALAKNGCSCGAMRYERHLVTSPARLAERSRRASIKEQADFFMGKLPEPVTFKPVCASCNEVEARHEFSAYSGLYLCPDGMGTWRDQ